MDAFLIDIGGLGEVKRAAFCDCRKICVHPCTTTHICIVSSSDTHINHVNLRGEIIYTIYTLFTIALTILNMFWTELNAGGHVGGAEG